MSLSESLQNATTFRDCINIIPDVKKELKDKKLQISYIRLILSKALSICAKHREEYEEVAKIAAEYGLKEMNERALRMSSPPS